MKGSSEPRAEDNVNDGLQIALNKLIRLATECTKNNTRMHNTSLSGCYVCSEEPGSAVARAASVSMLILTHCVRLIEEIGRSG